MMTIRGMATMTSKGQVTLPKAIRQALNLDAGSRLAFILLGNEIVITRENEHNDPAVASFLNLLEQDIAHGRHVSTLPDDLVKSLVTALEHNQGHDQEISGDVDL
ncbi:type II toxin-antitoxin system PrlF family antitoxin [Desulfonatronovibrio hydrogenovorans]|uniref:type II toxin-antitoxin system PrlF family antitoxin n=1 Tax=Desulfonatronovibrio hydrogenovorans TaxID=53245 RepID=UPI0004902E36|nr:type II toxin-antitoxin system PrlF family antitoxin [Desulfonatronovibrio hydrogenovorans]